MIRYVLASHGKMAEGMLDSVRLILGESIEVHTICAYTQGPENLTEKIEKLFSCFSQEDQIIVMTDIFGGSVNTEFAGMLAKRKFWLVSGMSLGLVAEILLIKDESAIEDGIKTAIENTRNMTCLYNSLQEDAADTFDIEI